jgi:hypothetical protein
VSSLDVTAFDSLWRTGWISKNFVKILRNGRNVPAVKYNVNTYYGLLLWFGSEFNYGRWDYFKFGVQN